jgi:hypothetical protein
VDIYRVTDGKISEERVADDAAAIMAQIGAINRGGLPGGRPSRSGESTFR